jgi:LmbE family N-acetylglucosaminyl deacetylase
MRELMLRNDARTPLRVLCLGAHADDIEIGCGGLVLDLLRRGARLDVSWVVFSANPDRAREAKTSARTFLDGAHKKTITIHRFRDGFFPYEGAKIKQTFESLKRSTPSPDLVLTHYRDDRHQDHRVVSDLTWNTFRDHFVLEYEIPKFDGDMGTPNCFVPLTHETCTRKGRLIEQAFATQANKHWFSAETFVGLMRLRGVECRAPEGFAEAFYARKVVMSTERA